MPLHPQAAVFIQQWLALAPKRVELSTPDELRQNMRAAMATNAVAVPGITSSDRVIEGPAGEIPIRIYRPRHGELGPALVFYHGGGWVAGDIDTHDGVCRGIAAAADCTVVSVDYRMAPEYRFPHAAEDCYAALQWVAHEADALQIDPQRIAVAGDSAGGNLAAVVSLMARDRAGHAPAQQILIYPIVNCDFTTGSYERYAEGHLLTRSAMQWFWDQYVPHAEQRLHPYVSPLQADLTELPPAVVIVAECDVLHDEGQAYAELLRAANVPVQTICYDGMIHGFLHRLSIFDDARRLVDRIGELLRGK